MSQNNLAVNDVQHTILLVDDDPHILNLLDLILSQHYRVICANNGQEALNLVINHSQGQDIHLVLTDQRMPEMSGTELLEQVRGQLPKAKRILMTAYQDISVVMAAINELDVYQVILKPFEQNELLLKVRRALECFVAERQQEKLIDDLYAANQALALSQSNLHQMLQRQSNTEMLASLGSLVADMSYEIDTPIGLSITTASSLEDKTQELMLRAKEMNLSKDFMSQYQALAYESCRLISRNLEKAVDMLHAFKEFSIDLTANERRHFNLKQYIDDILLTLMPRLKHSKHSIAINCPDNIVLVSYPGAITKIITSLVSYALNNSYTGNMVGNMVLDINREDHKVILIFRDNGKFVEQETLDAFFLPLYGSENIPSHKWLGLNAVNRIINETLNGSLDCESSLEHGTKFTITLPIENGH
ncbi:hybrid sensor histidine kinase/response regulator [Thalassomonas viridans]|uniref:Hybrid sensor histidine kinase/response regulator n=1 Tax=Thalassomonas viridans TaxID=137584 RepID=A0AAF0C878_9GAMM|nr:hybrid sensor histidine kinase/response regulator [Thalassomonas viridans]WDE06117.1 hybrid sensor histidine kinase/response regulator [Thalassomonas viridans]